MGEGADLCAGLGWFPLFFFRSRRDLQSVLAGTSKEPVEKGAAWVGIVSLLGGTHNPSADQPRFSVEGRGLILNYRPAYKFSVHLPNFILLK
jgi:hypothetical protein